MKKTAIWLSVILFALGHLSCTKDPQAPVHHKDPSNPNAPSGSLQSLPYSQSFVDDFGTYMAYDAFGMYSWVIDNGAAKMPDFPDDITYCSNEDYLISSPVAIPSVTNAKVTLTYAQQYSSGSSNGITIQVSSDYVYGDDPKSATWTNLPVETPNTSGLLSFQTVEASLNDYIGQNVTVAVKYISAEGPSCIIRIQNITIQEGEVGSVIPPGANGEVQALPYSQSFTSELGTYMTYDVAGAQSWMIDYSTATITGYVNSTYYVNEDWLISSPVSLSGVNDAKMIVEYIGRYFGNINEYVTIWASTNYIWGKAPSTATWTHLSAELVQGTNWVDFLTAEIALTQFVGQTVTLAVRYVSDNSQAGTLEIQSITIEEGSAANSLIFNVQVSANPTNGGIVTGSGTYIQGQPCTVMASPNNGYIFSNWTENGTQVSLDANYTFVVTGNRTLVAHFIYASGEGSGTADDPYNVTAGIALQSEQPEAWVHGYIVGAVKSGISSVTSNNDVNWGAPFDLATNVVIADDATCNEITQCIFVNLPANKPLRNEVNLLDHPENLGKQLAVLGKLRPYYGQAGLRDSGGTEDDFSLDGSHTPVGEIYSETFATGQGSFTIQDVTLPSGLTYVWVHSSNTLCMKATAYLSGQSYASESWLVSPHIDLSGANSATLSFDQALNYASPVGNVFVLISTNYNGNVTASTWTELNLNQWPDGSNWSFVSSAADLTPYVGQTVTIAFKYTSTTSVNPSWEVKNFAVME